MNLRKKTPRFVPLTLLASCLGLVSMAVAATWSLTGAIGTHDPGITKQGSTWWIAETGGNGIPVKYSGDGHAWTQGVPVFGGGLSWWRTYNGNTTGTWAGEFGTFGGQTLLYYSVSTFGSKKSAIGLATASSIQAGNWADKGVVVSSSASTPYNAIDPSFVVDASGSPWLVFGSWSNGIYLTRLNTSTLKPTGGLYNVAKANGGIEGPTIVRNGGYYYLFVSKGTCCSGASSTYHIDVGRSTSITGPYLDKAGIDMLSGGGTTLDSSGPRFKAPGGQSVLNNGGNWVLARHALDSQANYNPILFINDLYWSGGWPTY